MTSFNKDCMYVCYCSLTRLPGEGTVPEEAKKCCRTVICDSSFYCFVADSHFWILVAPDQAAKLPMIDRQ